MEEALKALPDLNFWVPYSMTEGPFLACQIQLWGDPHRQVEGPFGTYIIRIFDLKLCDLDRCHIRFLGFQIVD